MIDFELVKEAFLDELTKISAELTEAARGKIAPKNFALTPKQSDTGEGKYPIEDKHHAANALARVKQFGTPTEKSEVYKDVARKYPELAAHSSVAAVKDRAKAASEGLKAFGKGMLEEIGPMAGAMGGAGFSAYMKHKGSPVNPLAASGAGYGLGSLGQLAVEKALGSKSSHH